MTDQLHYILFLMNHADYLSKMATNFQRKNIIFNLSDGVYVPMKQANELLRNDYLMIKIVAGDPKQPGNKFIYAKVVGYDAPENNIVIPDWMTQHLGLKTGNLVQIVTKKINTIVNIKINVSKIVVDPTTILEFELRHRNILMIGDKINSKIFEKTYVFEIKEIQTLSGVSDVGALYGNNIISNVNFEIEFS